MLPSFTIIRSRLHMSPFRGGLTTYIACFCLMFLLAACDFIPDQDACIQRDASLKDDMYFTIDTTRVYDTSASTISCIVKYKNGSPARGWPASIVVDKKQVKNLTGPDGRAEHVWVEQGTYSLEVGNPSEYPCVLIHNLRVVGGRGYEVTVNLPTNE